MKEVFQSNPERKKWLADVVAHPMFKEAKVHAIAQYVRSLGGEPGDEHRIMGGVRILKILEELTEEPKKN